MSATNETGCTLCIGAMPEGEWCRACGNGLYESEIDAGDVEPMTGLPLAIRVAKGGLLSTDGEVDARRFYAGCRTEEGRRMIAGVRPYDDSRKDRQ